MPVRHPPYRSVVVVIREALREDADFLARMVAVAFDWRAGVPVRSVPAVLDASETARYVAGWPHAGERGVVAEVAGPHRVGAAWWRYLPVDDPGYGFVDVDVPELSLGVASDHRGQGLGTALMRNLVALARAERLRALSLSVEPDNVARRLYERLGFVQVGTNGGSMTMLLDLV